MSDKQDTKPARAGFKLVQKSVKSPLRDFWFKTLRVSCAQAHPPSPPYWGHHMISGAACSWRLFRLQTIQVWLRMLRQLGRGSRWRARALPSSSSFVSSGDSSGFLLAPADLVSEFLAGDFKSQVNRSRNFGKSLLFAVMPRAWNAFGCRFRK